MPNSSLKFVLKIFRLNLSSNFKLKGSFLCYYDDTTINIADTTGLEVVLSSLLDYSCDWKKLQSLLILSISWFPTKITAVLRKIDKLVVRFGLPNGVFNHQVSSPKIWKHISNRFRLRAIFTSSFWRRVWGRSPETFLLVVHLSECTRKQVAYLSYSLSSSSR